MNTRGGESIVALGLMSGTSLDGVDAALIETDGVRVTDIGVAETFPYPDDFRSRLAAEVREAGEKDRPTDDPDLEDELTRYHIEAVEILFNQKMNGEKWASPTVIGFHGHTTLHRPARKFTQQIGNASLLANSLGVQVVSDFRASDVCAGGQGAPLAPAFHEAMVADQAKPVAIVNVGGIANITWIGSANDDVIAFDTGPGNGLLDVWVEQQTGNRFDQDGKIASSGQIDDAILESQLKDPYFDQAWPKSLDRSDFTTQPFEVLDLPNGAATLTEFTVKSICQGLAQCPSTPTAVFVTGGGRRNRYMMSRLKDHCPCPVQNVDDLGWNGDAVEAQAFAFLAVRSMRKLPITFPGTTGVSQPLLGGKLTCPNNAESG